MRRRDPLTDEVKRHISAARAFHTGLQADTHRVKDVVQKMATHLDVMRRSASALEERLSAAERSCGHLKVLETLHRAWTDTYHDLRRSIRRVRVHLNRMRSSKRQGSFSKPR
jgi:hypothetical protein